MLSKFKFLKIHIFLIWRFIIILIVYTNFFYKNLLDQNETQIFLTKLWGRWPDQHPITVVEFLDVEEELFILGTSPLLISSEIKFSVACNFEASSCLASCLTFYKIWGLTPKQLSCLQKKTCIIYKWKVISARKMKKKRGNIAKQFGAGMRQQVASFNSFE